MNDLEKVTEEPLAPEVKINWHDAVSDGLLWLNERAWPLGGGILFMSALYLHNYIQTEQIPLSITSPVIVTALPTLFAMLILVIALLSSLILIPTAMLFTPMKKGEPPQIACMSADGTAENIRQRKWLAFQWLAGLTVVGAFWILIVFFAPVRDAHAVFQFMGFVLTLLLFIVAVNFTQLRRARRSPRGVSGDYIFSCLISSLVQVLVTLYAFSVTEVLASQYESNVWTQVLYMTIGLVILWFIQFAGANLLLGVMQHQNPVAYVTLIAAVVISVLGLISPVSSKLAGYAFQFSASGGKPCAVFTWSSNHEVGVDSLSQHATRNSIPLRVLAKADDYYLVRPHGTMSKAVTFVPQQAVAIIDECTTPDKQ